MSAPNSSSISEIAAVIGRDIAGPAAADVDKEARFPIEAITALREAKLMSALVPLSEGGSGASITELSQAVLGLSRYCASTAMIFAMHQIQVACLVRHERTPALQQLQDRLVAEQLLLGSATTEKGIGGDVRSSTCAVNVDGDEFALVKDAPVISYGEYADVIFTTARRTPDSPPSDQSLVACDKAGLALEPTGSWDTLGFRGTCSPGFILNATGPKTLIFPDSYSDISAQTMLPVAHTLWGHVWLGIATAAVDTARTFVRAAARRSPGTTPPGAIRLADLMTTQQEFIDLVSSAARRLDEFGDDREAISAPKFAIVMNGVKVSASTLVIEVVSKALLIVGIAGYRNGGKFGLGLQLRDSYGGALMVNNDRIALNTAQMLLVTKD
ncbi:MAG: acyl-CoA dehydrogenase family protein [Candidatus Nanopelagicales bacterium]